ncbi:MAG: Cna B-type domain-containing protein [Clostridiales bacterium]|nr:Cna B-type domain-containing protein [Clostridiales bacterium]
MNNNQTNRHKSPLFMRLIALALTCAMAISASNVSVYAADVLGDSSAASSADVSVDASSGDSSTDPADSSEDSSGTASTDASDSSGSTGAEDASAGEEENATEDTGDPDDESEAEADESAADESGEADAIVTAAADPPGGGGQGGGGEGGGGSGGGSSYDPDAITNAAEVYHIDIGIKASASVTIGSTTYSNSSIQIDSTDFTSSAVTITATQNGTALKGTYDSSYFTQNGSDGNAEYTIADGYDFAYNFSDLSSSEGDSEIVQVRMGGYFPVGTYDNQVYYTFTLTKTVTLYAGGDTSSSDTITVPVAFTATFSYWDEDNDCPGITRADEYKEAWAEGYVIEASGLDFVLEIDSEVIAVYKRVVDTDGNLLTQASGHSYSFTATDGSGGTYSSSITVGSSGIGVTYLSVDDTSSLAVSETTPTDTITVGSSVYTYQSTSYSAYDSSAHTITITNVYGVSTTSVTVTKEWDDDDYANRPTSITVKRMNGTTVVDTAELSANNNWTYTFTDLAVSDSNGTITYTVEEETVSGYTASYDGYAIINTLNTGSLTLTKTVNADTSIDTSGLSFYIYVVGDNGELDNLDSVEDSEGEHLLRVERRGDHHCPGGRLRDPGEPARGYLHRL